VTERKRNCDNAKEGYSSGLFFQTKHQYFYIAQLLQPFSHNNYQIDYSWNFMHLKIYNLYDEF